MLILLYHRVLKKPDPMRPGDIEIATFETHLRALSRYFKVLPLSEVVERLQTRSLPRRVVSITFDDGYADNCEVALPILRSLNLTATFFIATGFLDQGRMWNDTIIEAVRRAQEPVLDLSEIGLEKYPVTTVQQRCQVAAALIGALKYLPLQERHKTVDAIKDIVAVDLPDDLMMSTDQVRMLSANGMEIGAHTVTHPILARIDDSTARCEIREGKASLEEITRAPVRLFAYPNGLPGQDYGPRHVEMVKQLGFSAAVSATAETAHPSIDIYQLPRFIPWDKTLIRFVFRLLFNRLRQ